jgi:hypothetical protein
MKIHGMAKVLIGRRNSWRRKAAVSLVFGAFGTLVGAVSGYSNEHHSGGVSPNMKNQRNSIHGFQVDSVVGNVKYFLAKDSALKNPNALVHGVELKSGDKVYVELDSKVLFSNAETSLIFVGKGVFKILNEKNVILYEGDLYSKTKDSININTNLLNGSVQKNNELKNEFGEIVFHKKGETVQVLNVSGISKVWHPKVESESFTLLPGYFTQNSDDTRVLFPTKGESVDRETSKELLSKFSSEESFNDRVWARPVEKIVENTIESSDQKIKMIIHRGKSRKIASVAEENKSFEKENDYEPVFNKKINNKNQQDDRVMEYMKARISGEN